MGSVLGWIKPGEQTRAIFGERLSLRFGIHRYALFPDLNGLSAHLSVLYTRDFSLQLTEFSPATEDEEERLGLGALLTALQLSPAKELHVAAAW